MSGKHKSDAFSRNIYTGWAQNLLVGLCIDAAHCRTSLGCPATIIKCQIIHSFLNRLQFIIIILNNSTNKRPRKLQRKKEMYLVLLPWRNFLVSLTHCCFISGVRHDDTVRWISVKWTVCNICGQYLCLSICLFERFFWKNVLFILGNKPVLDSFYFYLCKFLMWADKIFILKVDCLILNAIMNL